MLISVTKAEIAGVSILNLVGELHCSPLVVGVGRRVGWVGGDLVR